MQPTLSSSTGASTASIRCCPSTSRYSGRMSGEVTVVFGPKWNLERNLIHSPEWPSLISLIANNTSRKWQIPSKKNRLSNVEWKNWRSQDWSFSSTGKAHQGISKRRIHSSTSTSITISTTAGKMVLSNLKWRRWKSSISRASVSIKFSSGVVSSSSFGGSFKKAMKSILRSFSDN